MKLYFFMLHTLFVLLALTGIAKADHDPCRPGDTVWTESGSEGQVQAVFPDGRLSVRIAYSDYVMNRSQLAFRGCWQSLCSGQNVITSSGSQGTVNGVFPSGAFSVKVAYSNYKLAYENLASTNPRYQNPYGPQVGQTVWTRSGSEGSVAGIFPSGELSVKVAYSFYKMALSQIAIQGCTGNLCSGDNVITTSGSRGVVNGVFNDNRTISVKIAYSNYALDYSQLAKTWH